MRFRRAQSPKHVRSATTKDVSLNGMGLVTPIPLDVGERVHLENRFGSAVAVVRSVGRRNGRRVHGVEFLTLGSCRSAAG